MRLNSKEIQSIVRIAKEIYGEDVSVYLFGSRTDIRNEEAISIS